MTNHVKLDKYSMHNFKRNIYDSQGKRECYTIKFENFITYPKHAWQTFNDVLGRNSNQTIIHEIEHSGKSVVSTEELKEMNTLRI